MRAMIIAGALLAAATSANAAEPAACYDAAVVGTVTDYANGQMLDSTPYPADRILPRVQADALVKNWMQVSGLSLPKMFWARATLTGAPDPNTELLIYLKNEPDGVPSVVGYRTTSVFARRPAYPDYAVC